MLEEVICWYWDILVNICWAVVLLMIALMNNMSLANINRKQRKRKSQKYVALNRYQELQNVSRIKLQFVTGVSDDAEESLVDTHMARVWMVSPSAIRNYGPLKTT